jgi:hypothetical protein
MWGSRGIAPPLLTSQLNSQLHSPVGLRKVSSIHWVRSRAGLNAVVGIELRFLDRSGSSSSYTDWASPVAKQTIEKTKY